MRRISWRTHAIAGGLLVVALAAGYLVWFRDSSFVSVSDVKVEGVTSSDGPQITAALTDAAKGMTTLDVDTGALVAAARRFPTVAAVSADPDFPHGLTIHVTERTPVLIAEADGHAVPVASDGTLLYGLPATDLHLATVAVPSFPSTGAVTGTPLEEARLLGAAPPPLRPLVDQVTTSTRYGIVFTLRGGVDLRFGTPSQAHAKWRGAAAVLADPRLTTLSYVDVRVPARPAVGGAGAPPTVATTVPPPPAATNPATTATVPATTAAPVTTTPTTP